MVKSLLNIAAEEYVAEKTIKPDVLVQIARLALTGRPQDVQLYIRRLAKRYQGAFLASLPS